MRNMCSLATFKVNPLKSGWNRWPVPSLMGTVDTVTAAAAAAVATAIAASHPVE